MIHSELSTEEANLANPATEPSSWDNEMAALRKRYPKASDGILFCVFKLLQNPELTIRDFRDEALLHGIRIGGRAIHSAKVLLGMEKPSVRRANIKTSTPRMQTEGSSTDLTSTETTVQVARPKSQADGEVESSLISAIQQIQNAATADSRRLREAMRRAVDVLQRALDGREDPE